MATQFEIDCALMAGGAYVENRAGINQFPAPSGWRVIPLSHFYDTATSFEAISYRSDSDSNNVAVSYAGTDELVDWFANGGLAFGFATDQLRQAVLYYLQVREINPGATISFTGHSLGGGLAALMGVLFDEQAVTFDQAPFAAAASTSVRDSLVTWLNDQGYDQTRLASLAPELLSYGGNGERSGNVTGQYVEGEALHYPPFSFFSTIGSQTPLTHGDYFGPEDLHSQALLTAFVQSTAFREMTGRLPWLLEMIFDENLFAIEDLKRSTPNLLEHLIRHQIGLRDPSTGAVTLAADAMLDRFTADLDRLVVARGGAGGYRDLIQALIAFAMEKYYAETDASPGYQHELFLAVAGGLQFDARDVAADITTARGYRQYFTGYLDTDPLFSFEERSLIRQEIAGLTDWSVAVGADGMAATDAGNRGAFMLGGDGGDAFTGGTADDVLAGVYGNDNLDGGAGADTLLGGTGNDTLTGGSGSDLLIGGAGNDTYYADEGDTIRDSDGQGTVYLNGKRLTFATRRSGESAWHDAEGNTYTLANGTLSINDPLLIEGFDNGELGIYLDEEEDPNDPGRGPRPPGYNPDAASLTRRVDPLVLDLDGNGRIDAVASSASTVYFDFNGDGLAERAGWIAPADGFLALDANANGAIDGLDELFGTEALDGFAELAAHDENNDGAIDGADAVFPRLLVWQDANGDGISQAGELKTLAELGIERIGLAATAQNLPLGDNLLAATGSYTRNGEQHLAADVQLAVNFTLTDANPNRPLGLPPALDAGIFELPWLRGYGEVSSLPIACQQDPALRQSAAELAGGGGLHALRHFERFLAEWTGLDRAHAEHGVARTILTLEDKLWMLETLTGRNTWRGQIEAAHFGAIDPGANRFWNAAHIEGAWSEFARRQALGFAVQAGARDWLAGVSYSLNLDRFVLTDAPRLQNTLLDHLIPIRDRKCNNNAMILMGGRSWREKQAGQIKWHRHGNCYGQRRRLMN